MSNNKALKETIENIFLIHLMTTDSFLICKQARIDDIGVNCTLEESESNIWIPLNNIHYIEHIPKITQNELNEIYYQLNEITEQENNNLQQQNIE